MQRVEGRQGRGEERDGAELGVYTERRRGRVCQGIRVCQSIAVAEKNGVSCVLFRGAALQYDSSTRLRLICQTQLEGARAWGNACPLCRGVVKVRLVRCSAERLREFARRRRPMNPTQSCPFSTD